MATYVENAILRVTDQSSDRLDRINQAMLRLHGSATRLSGALGSVRTAGVGSDLARLARQVEAVDRAMSRLNQIRTPHFNLPNIAAPLGSGLNTIDRLASALRNLNNIGSGEQARAAILNISRALNVAASARADRFAAALDRVSASIQRLAGAAVQLPDFNRVIPPGMRGPGVGADGGYRSRWPFPWDYLRRGVDRRSVINTGAFVHESVTSSGRGVVDADTARFNLMLRAGHWPGVYERLQALADAQSRTFRSFTRADMMEIYGQMLSNMPLDRGPDGQAKPPDVEKLAKAGGTMAWSIDMLTQLYGDRVTGQRAAYELFRAMDLMGIAHDPDKLHATMRAVVSRMMVLGKDVSGYAIASFMQRVGSAKYGLSPEAVGDMASLIDEQRGQAALSMRTFFRDLTRATLNERSKAALVAAGLRRPDGGAVDQELLQADPLAWIVKHIRPRAVAFARAEGVDLDSKETDDATKAAVLNRFLNTLGYVPSATEAPAALLLKLPEFMAQREAAARVLALIDQVTKSGPLADQTIRGGHTAVGAQWQDMADKLTLAWGLQSVYQSTIGLMSRLIGWVGDNPYSAPGILGLGAAGVGWAAKKAIETGGDAAAVAGRGHVAGRLSAAATALKAAADRLSKGAMVPVGVAPGASVPSVGNAAATAAAATQAGAAARAAAAAVHGQPTHRPMTYWERIRSAAGYTRDAAAHGASAARAYIGSSFVGRMWGAIAGSWVGRGVSRGAGAVGAGISAAGARILAIPYLGPALGYLWKPVIALLNWRVMVADLIASLVTGKGIYERLFEFVLGGGSAKAATPEAPKPATPAPNATSPTADDLKRAVGTMPGVLGWLGSTVGAAADAVRGAGAAAQPPEPKYYVDQITGAVVLLTEPANAIANAAGVVDSAAGTMHGAAGLIDGAVAGLHGVSGAIESALINGGAAVAAQIMEALSAGVNITQAPAAPALVGSNQPVAR